MLGETLTATNEEKRAIIYSWHGVEPMRELAAKARVANQEEEGEQFIFRAGSVYYITMPA